VKVQGRCHCGRITYTATVDPEKVSLCHCRDCQMLSGSAYRASVPAPRETFELHGIAPKIYVKTAESGAKRSHAFCPECGTPIYSAAIDDPPTFSLRVGCLDRRAELRPRKQIWCRSALDWARDLEGIVPLDRQ
jgi:hypothetical protein